MWRCLSWEWGFIREMRLSYRQVIISGMTESKRMANQSQIASAKLAQNIQNMPINLHLRAKWQVQSSARTIWGKKKESYYHISLISKQYSIDSLPNSNCIINTKKTGCWTRSWNCNGLRNTATSTSDILQEKSIKNRKYVVFLPEPPGKRS